MKPLNLSKASLQEISKLKGFGEQRAQTILKLRNANANGKVTQEALEASSIPRSVWSPLLQEGKAVLDSPESSPQGSPTHASGPAKTVKPPAEAAADQTVAPDLSGSSAGDQLAQILDLVRKGQEISLQTRREAMGFRDELRQRLDAVEGQVANVLDRFDANDGQMMVIETKIKNFDDQFSYMQTKFNELTCRVKVVEGRAPSKEQTTSTSQTKLLLDPTKLMVDPPDDDLGYNLPDVQDRKWPTAAENQRGMDAILRQTSAKAVSGKYDPSLPPLFGRSAWDRHGTTPTPQAEPRKTPTSSTPPGPRRDNWGPSPSAPKMATFDGKSDTVEWAPFILQFERLAHRHGWEVDLKLDKLVECLRGRALNYYSQLPEPIRECYDALRFHLQSRYGRQEPPTTARRQLQELHQEADEKIPDFAERAQKLAYHGFPDAPIDVVETVAVDAFLKGCAHKQAALTAMNRSPQSVRSAVQMVIAAMHNQNVLLGDKTAKTKVRQLVRFAEEEEEEPVVRQVAGPDVKSEIISAFKAECQDTRSQLKEIVELLKQSYKATLGRSRSPSPRRGCFKCGEDGHFASDCKVEQEVRSCYRCG